MTESQPAEIRTVFTRSNFCRVIRSDGVWGGITPQRAIHLALFTERWALAQSTSIHLDDLKDYPVDPPGVITREIEVDVILTEEAAVFLQAWLGLKIDELRAQAPVQPEA